MNKIIFALIIASSIFPTVHAQKKVVVRKQISTIPNVKAAYLGSIKYPCFKLGLELPRYAKEKTITKKSGVKKIKLKERFITLNLGAYFHPTYHNNIMLGAEWQMRTTRKNGWFTEFAPGLGISRTILAGTTYKQNATGDFSKVSFAGNFYGMASVLGGFGYDFNIKKAKPYKVYCKGGLLIFAPYNSFLLPRPTIELGIITSLHTFKKSNK